jgi:hypothetical protein
LADIAQAAAQSRLSRWRRQNSASGSESCAGALVYVDAVFAEVAKVKRKTDQSGDMIAAKRSIERRQVPRMESPVWFI